MPVSLFLKKETQMMKAIIGPYQSYQSCPKYWNGLFLYNYDQLYDYLSNKSLFNGNQSCVRKSFSTINALIYLLDIVRKNIEKYLYTGMGHSGTRKAFDTVYHQVLLPELSNIGADLCCR